MGRLQTDRASDKHAAMANVALLYYGEGLTQGDIARRLKVSRATVVNMLRDAHLNGIIDIRVSGKSLTGSTLALDLRDRFGLADVYVSHGGGETRNDMLRQLGRVGATALSEIVKTGDRLGIAWGETIRAVSEQMPRTVIEDVQVFQMIGSMVSDSVPTSEGCTIEIANNLGARCFTLHAPALASSPEIAALFRAEPTIRNQIDALTTLDMTVAAVGDVSDETHLARAGIVSLPDLARARDAGATGILCCRFIDAVGAPLSMPPDDSLIAPRLEDIRRAERRLLVVGGADRAAATLAAIRGGFVSHLCVDQALATALLRQTGGA